MPTSTDEPLDWTPIIGRSLAYLCLFYSDLTKRPLVDQAEFLTRLGLPRRQAAQLLGTSEDSLRVMASQRARKGAKRGNG